jgi:hypothetical protein
LVKREFIIDTGSEKIQTEGHAHKNVALKYLMKRRRSVLMTRNSVKVERLFSELPTLINVKGKQIAHKYKINWQRTGINEFEGSRFVFSLNEIRD